MRAIEGAPACSSAAPRLLPFLRIHAPNLPSYHELICQLYLEQAGAAAPSSEQVIRRVFRFEGQNCFPVTRAISLGQGLLVAEQFAGRNSPVNGSESASAGDPDHPASIKDQ